jgi:hypothetical protein
MRLRRVTSDWIYNEPFWYDLSRAGLGVVVIDVPFLLENRLPDAIEVINWGSHDLTGKFDANLPALRREIRRRFGRHPMGYEIPVSKDRQQLIAMKQECVIGAKVKDGRDDADSWRRSNSTRDRMMFLHKFKV